MKIKKFNENINEDYSQCFICDIVEDNGDIYDSGVFENLKDRDNWLLITINQIASQYSDDWFYDVKDDIFFNEEDEWYYFIDLQIAKKWLLGSFDYKIKPRDSYFYKDVKLTEDIITGRAAKKYNL